MKLLCKKTFVHALPSCRCAQHHSWVQPSALQSCSEAQVFDNATKECKGKERTIAPIFSSILSEGKNKMKVYN